jgi:hypothetical protein
LRAAAPRLRVIGVLSAQSRFGDRAELVQALRRAVRRGGAGRLSATALAALAGRDRSPTGRSAPPLHARTGSGHHITPAAGAALAGNWRIALTEQRANFDAGTLEQRATNRRKSAAAWDWKSLSTPTTSTACGRIATC